MAIQGAQSTSEEQVVKIIFVAKAEKPLQHTFNYLRKRGWQVQYVGTVKELMELIPKDKPTHVLISCNLPNTNVIKSEKMITATYLIPCIVFTEKVLDGKTQSTLTSSTIRHHMLLPVSGPSVHMKIKNIISDQLNKGKKSDRSQRVRGEARRLKCESKDLPGDGEWKQVGESESGEPIWTLTTKKRQLHKGQPGTFVFKGSTPPKKDEKGSWTIPGGDLKFEVVESVVQDPGTGPLTEIENSSELSSENSSSTDMSEETSLEDSEIPPEFTLDSKGRNLNDFKAYDKANPGPPLDKKTLDKERRIVENFKRDEERAKLNAEIAARKEETLKRSNEARQAAEIARREKKRSEKYSEPMDSLAISEEELESQEGEQRPVDNSEFSKKSHKKGTPFDSEGAKERFKNSSFEDDSVGGSEHEEKKLGGGISKSREKDSIETESKNSEELKSRGAFTKETIEFKKANLESGAVISDVEAKKQRESEEIKANQQRKRNNQARKKKLKQIKTARELQKQTRLAKAESHKSIKKEKEIENEIKTGVEKERPAGDRASITHKEQSGRNSKLPPDKEKSAASLESKENALVNHEKEKIKEEEAVASEVADKKENPPQSTHEDQTSQKPELQAFASVTQSTVDLKHGDLKIEIKLSGKKSDTLLASSVVKALEATVVGQNVTSILPLSSVKQVDAIPINSDRFKGLLIFAMSGDRRVGSEFSRSMKNYLIELMNAGGEKLLDEGELELTVPPLEFIRVGGEFGEFLTLSQHFGAELGVTYLYNDQIFPVTKANERGMIKIDKEILQANQILTFDAHIHMPINGKYVRYLKKGGQLLDSQKAKLDKLDMKHFYVKEEEVKELKGHCASKFVEEIVKAFAKIAAKAS